MRRQLAQAFVQCYACRDWQPDNQIHWHDGTPLCNPQVRPACLRAHLATIHYPDSWRRFSKGKVKEARGK